MLWPTYPGSLYGRAARDPERKAQLDADLRELLDFFGRDRLLELALHFHVEMSKGRTPPRTFLGHMDKLRKRMIYEITLQSDDVASASVGRSSSSDAVPAAPQPYVPRQPSDEEMARRVQIYGDGIAAAREALSHHRKQDPAAYDQADRVRAAEDIEDNMPS